MDLNTSESAIAQFFDKVNQYPHYAYAILLMNGAPTDLYDSYHTLRMGEGWPLIQSTIQQQMKQILTRITSTGTKPATKSQFSLTTPGDPLKPLETLNATTNINNTLQREARLVPMVEVVEPETHAGSLMQAQRRPAWRCPKKDCPRYRSPYSKKGHFINHLKNIHDQRSISPDRYLVDGCADSVISQQAPEAAEGSRGIPFKSDTSSTMRQHVHTAPSRMYPGISSEDFSQKDIGQSALSYPNYRGRSELQTNDTNHWQEAVVGYTPQYNSSHKFTALQNSHPYLIAGPEKATISMASDAEDVVSSCDWDNQGMDQFIEQRKFG